MPLKSGDIVLCKVTKIENASVIVEIENEGEGTIVMSEIAAGRIRNLRDYVAPNKKIVCKVLSNENDHIQLSLRRVTAKERDECQAHYQKEKTFLAMLKSVTKEPQKVMNDIKAENDVAEFVDEIKANPKLLDKYLEKKEAEQIIKILSEKKESEKQVKHVFLMRTTADSGLDDIKSILNTKEVEIKYLGSSQFSISAIGKDFKEANNKVQKALQNIENKAKAKKIFFELKEDK